jgi:hypothetical protein
LTPLIILILLLIFYILPLYLKLCCFRFTTDTQRRRSVAAFYRLFLYCLFLLYVSSVFMQLLVCRATWSYSLRPVPTAWCVVHDHSALQLCLGRRHSICEGRFARAL